MKFQYTDAIEGTSLQGFVKTTYAKLTSIFGEPNWGPTDKTNSEWVLEFSDGTVATIYDWMMDSTPHGEYNWHVGGHSRAALYHVVDTLQNS